MNLIITGGSRGLGLEIARHQLQLGNSLYIVNRSQSDALIELSASYPDRIQFIPCDFSEPDSIKEHVFEKHIGFDVPIHGLVNNAAVADDALLSNQNLQSIENMFCVNVYSAMLMTKHVVRSMLFHKIAGSIVHVSSICAHTGYKGLSMYAASKGAIEAFSKNIAREWGAKGIRSNCVVPGFMETEMSSGIDSGQLERMKRRTSLQAHTSLKSVAESVHYLLSDASKSVTGQNLIVDSGTV